MFFVSCAIGMSGIAMGCLCSAGAGGFRGCGGHDDDDDDHDAVNVDDDDSGTAQ